MTKLPTFHSGQRYVYQNLSRFNLIVCGRRWRKTTFGSAYLFREASRRKGTYLWGSPTHDQNKIAFNYMLTYGQLEANRSSMTLSFSSGSTVLFRSLNKPDNARGFTLHGVCIDEAAYINGESWLEVLRPTLIDTGGFGILMSTPNSYNWLYELSNNDEYQYFNSPTMGCRIDGNKLIRTPHVLENDELRYSEIESLFNSMDSFSFRQEILAEFISSSINVFSSIYDVSTENILDKCVEHTYAGIDFAKSNDYTAVSIFKDDTEIFIGRLPHVPYNTQIELINDIFNRYNVRQCVYDGTGVGKAVEEMLLPLSNRVQFSSFVYTNEAKMNLINNMILMIEKKQVKLVNDKTATQECLSFVRKLSGNNVIFTCLNGHDDTVNARALALWCKKLSGIF